MSVPRGRLPARMAALLRCWSVSTNFSALYRQDNSTFHLINGLRFFSFAWILAFHTVLIFALLFDKSHFFTLADAASPALWWIWNADKAVDLFFIVSGFLIGLILLREKEKRGDINLGRFYFRRYLRLTPIYAVIALLYWLGNGSNAHTLWANLLYLNNFLPMDQTAMRWTWTLAVEEQFYLLLPLLLLFMGSTAASFWTWMGGLFLLSFLIRAAVIVWFPELQLHPWRALLEAPEISPIYYEKLYDNLATRYGPFVLGVMTAYAYLHHRHGLNNWCLQHATAAKLLNALALVLFFFFLFYPLHRTDQGQSGIFLMLYMVMHHNLFALAVGWFLLRRCLSSEKPSPMVRLLAWRGWQPFSQLTYSMYLIHLLLLGLVIRNVQANLSLYTQLSGDDLTLTILLISYLVALLLSVIIGVLCWLLVEKPFLNLRDLLSGTSVTHANPSLA